MSIDLSKMTDVNGYLEGPIDAISDVPRGNDYKRLLSNLFRLISPEQIDFKVTGDNFWVSRKYDGMMQVVVFDGTHTYMSGTGGTVRTDLPCLKQFEAVVKAAGHSAYCAAAELYVAEDGGRTRVYDVVSALADQSKHETLNLACFDLLEVDGEPFVRSNPYEDAFNALEKTFPTEGMVHLVETQTAASKKEVQAIYEEWVEAGNAEGVVVRSDMPLAHKIKPFHTLDVAVVGYTESLKADRKEQVKSLLVAFMREDGSFQLAGRVGTGFDVEQRLQLKKRLDSLVIPSNFIETDNDGIAFRMVKPEVIIEMRCCDIVTEIGGKSLQNPLLTLSDTGSSLERQPPGIRLFFNVFVRERDDKKPIHADVRLEQVQDMVVLPDESESTAAMPASELLFREVYTKISKGQTMVQKFLAWKTNKEDINPAYPAFVMHYTNFSAGRKDPLKRELRVAGSEESIMAHIEASIKKNIKKGWEKL